MGESNRWNNYAISTADLAQSLTKSSASLVAAGGDLAEAAALTATANAIIQDADSVGTALKTTALRLRGTDVKVLEEEGLDSDGAVASKSKLQSKVKALSGVDILTDAGDYKSTYEILSQIADVWEDISNMDQAALLELLAGKRNASVLAAILQSPEQLTAAYKDAQSAAGSAWQENEKYLDSIQGKIDQFNNALQAMWSGAINSDMVKSVVSLGTTLVNIVDKLGVIPSILAAILTYKLAIGAVKLFDLGSLGTYISMLFTANSATEVQGLLLNKTALAQKLLNSTLIQAQAARMDLTAADLAGYSVTQLLTLGVKGLIAGFKNLWIAMGPVGWAIIGVTAALTAGIAIFNAVHKTTEELAEELTELKTALQDIQSEIDTVNSELETMENRMAELLAKDSLTFTEEEELDRLQKENAELQRKLDLLKQEEQFKQKEMALKFNDTMTSANSDDYYVTGQKKEWWNYIVDGAAEATTPGSSGTTTNLESVLDSKIRAYENYADQLADIETKMANTDNKDEYDKLAKEKARIDGEMHEIQTYIGDKIKEMNANAEGLEYFTGDNLEDWQIEANKNLDKINNLKDKWAIAQGGTNAKTNTIIRIFNKEEYAEASDAIDDLVKQLTKDPTNKTVLDKIREQCELAEEDLLAVGLSVQDVVDYFTLESSQFNSDTLEGVISQYAKGAEILEQFKSTLNDTNTTRMKALQEGGSVDLFNRPQIDASKLTQAGWKDAGDGVATVFSSTFANEAGSIAMNFTPILPNGEILSPDELTEYAEAVIAGTRQDDLNLKIGSTFDGETAIQQAEQAAQEIHELQESYYMGGQTIKIDNIEYDWDEMFKANDEGEFEADAVKFAEVLKGLDNETRETFINIAESVKNGAKGWNEAIASFNISGIIASTKVLEAQWAEVNKSMFKDIDDGAISGWIDTFSELSAAFEDVASSMDLLHAAQTQMNNSGRISIKTALEIIESTDRWNEMLTITEDSIILNANAEDVLVQSKLNVIKAQVDEALGAVELQLAQLGAADSAYSVAIASDVSDEAYEQYTNAMNSYSASIAGFGAALDALLDGDKNTKVFDSFSQAYNTAKKIADTSVDNTRIDRSSLEQKQRDLTAQKMMLQQGGTVSGFKQNYDFDKTPGDKYDETGDALEALQKKYERHIKNLDNQQTYIQNEIDKLEAEDKVVSKSYYEDQIALEEKKLSLYQQERAELLKLERTDEVADALWETEHAIQESTLRMLEFRQSIIDLYKTVFDDIVGAYDNKDDLLTDRQDYIDKYNELLELQGKQPSSLGVQEQIAEEEQKMKDNISELNDLRSTLAQGMTYGKIKEGSEEWVEMQSQIRATEAEILDNKIAIEQYKEELKTLPIEAFESIRGIFNFKDEFLTNQQDYIQGYADQLETLGIDVPQEVYDKLVEIERDKRENNVANLVDARKGLAEIEAAGYYTADEEWQDAYSQVVELEKAIQDSDIAMAEWAKTIRDLDFEKFERFISRLEDLESEIGHLKGLFDDEDIANENGEWTEDGITTLGLLYHQMELAQQKSKEYADEINKLNEAYKNGSMSYQEYYEQLQKLKEGQWSAIESYENAKDAMVDMEETRIDMIEEGINKEIEAYQELIDAKREELDAERDLYDFRKNIKDQTKDIAELERRIASLSGSSAASDVAERRKLEAELAEAQDGLNDTYYNHAKDQQGQALDDEINSFQTVKDNYVESLREALENTEDVFERLITTVGLNADTISGNINDTTEERGVTLSDLLTNPWTKAGEAATAYKDGVGPTLNEMTGETGVITLFNTTATNSLANPFLNAIVAETGPIAQFEKAVSDTIGNVQKKVNGEDGTQNYLGNSLGKPWEDASKEDGPITTFSAAVNKAIEDAKKKVSGEEGGANYLGDNLDKPWETDAPNTFSSNVESALNETIRITKEKVAEINAETNKIKLPSYTGGDASGGGGNSGSGGGGSGGGTGGGGSETAAQKRERARKSAQAYVDKAGFSEGDKARWGQDSNFLPLLQALYAAGGTIDDLQGKVYTPPVDNKRKFTKATNSNPTPNRLVTTGLNIGSKDYNQSLEVTGQDGTYYPFKGDPNNGYVKKGEGYTVNGKKLDYHSWKPLYYAKGTTGTKRDQWAITDEPQFGDELVLVPGKDGNLSFMRKGTGVVPADLTANLMEWGQFTPDSLKLGGGVNVNMINNAVMKPQYDFSFDSLVHVDNCSQDTLKDLEKMVDTKINDFSKALNYSIKRFTR